MTSGLPSLPPIRSSALRKQAFTDISVYRLGPNPSLEELDRVENTDNNRLSFLGRSTLEYAFTKCTSHSFPDQDRRLDDGLALCAHTYDIVKLLNVAWTGTPVTDKEATRLMEAYVGALVLESEQEGVRFAEGVVTHIFQLTDPRPIVSPPLINNTGVLPSAPAPPAPTGLLHDLAKQHFLELVWEDSPCGPRHAPEWISDVTLKDTKSDRIWPCIARGMGTSKKLARADAASKALVLWNGLGFR
ncbi:Ribonuclease 3, partial [Rhizoctonia solani]